MSSRPLPPGSLLRANAPRVHRVTMAVMADHAERLQAAARVPWDAEGDAAALAREVAAGRALALDVLEHGRRLGSTFVRIVNRSGTRVLHVLGVVGEFPGGSLSAYFSACEEFALRMGCHWLECESSRPAMIRLFAEAGCTAAEVRFFKQLR